MARALNWKFFIVQKLVLHKNGVEFCQQFNGAIRTSLTATYDYVQRRATSPRNLLHRQETDTGTQPRLRLASPYLTDPR